jgi:membrane glycosyltransferase
MTPDMPDPPAPLPDPGRPWGLAGLPPEQPLAMPEQRFDLAPPLAVARPALPEMAWRRALLFGGSLAIGVVASCGLALPLAIDGFDLVDRLLVLLSVLLYAWLGFGFLNALAGFLTMRRTRPLPRPPLPRSRVAVLVPVYNEDTGPLAHRLGLMAADLARIGAAELFDLFVLSDSGPAAEPAERAMAAALDRPGARCFYRRRPVNAGRKPGNIADWVTRFGGAYPFMLVLDADSLMGADVVLRMAATLEADAGLGLVQTTPFVTGAETLFARWQQFAAGFYGPVAGAGLAWWVGDEATFWGHNAMLRTRAFADSCGLPPLSGPEPLGGAIQSHDMVEAALLRRRGWGCRLLAVAEGSWEEVPPTLADHAIRDRRWCQGNLQHLRLLEMAGLHWISRVQLLMGAFGYLSSPLWLAMLVGGLFVSVRTGTPMADLGTPPWLVALTLLLLFGTRALALAAALRDPSIARRLGGWRVVLGSTFADAALSLVAAPAIMASQTLAVVNIAAGRASGWRPQRRRTDGVGLAEALDGYRWHMLLGLVFWIVSLSELGGGLWSLPVALGLLGAPFLVAVSSRVDHGTAMARRGFFSADPARETRAAVDIEPARWRTVMDKATA